METASKTTPETISSAASPPNGFALTELLVYAAVGLLVAVRAGFLLLVACGVFAALRGRSDPSHQPERPRPGPIASSGAVPHA